MANTTQTTPKTTAPQRPGSTIEKAERIGIKREPGFLYFLRGTDIYKTPQRKAGTPVRPGSELVLRCTFVREDGYLYFLDIEGDVARAVDRYKRKSAPTAKTATVHYLHQASDFSIPASAYPGGIVPPRKPGHRTACCLRKTPDDSVPSWATRDWSAVTCKKCLGTAWHARFLEEQRWSLEAMIASIPPVRDYSEAERDALAALGAFIATAGEDLIAA